VRRVIHIFGRIGVGLSLLLSLCVAGMWVRSYWANEAWARWRYAKPTDETKLSRIVSERGRVEVTFLRTKYPSGVAVLEEGPKETTLTVPGFKCTYPNGWWRFAMTVSPPPHKHWWEHVGVVAQLERGLRWGISPGVGSYTYLGAPYWLLFLLTISAPALWALGWWKRRRRFREGHCRDCGYDLRETPEKCPECGAVALAVAEVRS
jgi:hypothetical protein